MAVVQISRIQIRRGTVAQGTSLPQLASGELAWALDSQELWIGNGSVSEGSPAVGNTKILTLNDLSANGNILGIIQYIYGFNNNVITNIRGGSTSRPIQQRLDDTIITTNFGTLGDGAPATVNGVLGYTAQSADNDTLALQLVINQTYLNPPAGYLNSGVASRRIINIPAGVYVLTSTLYVPSFATLQGAGSDKTIFYFNPTNNTGNPPAVKFVNDTYFTAQPTSTSSTNQPRSINMTGISIRVATGVNAAMELNSVRDSKFEDMTFVGNWLVPQTPSIYAVALQMTAFSASVTTEHNTFKDCRFEGWQTVASARYDVRNNIWDNCLINNAFVGFSFGADSAGTIADGATIGQLYGPRECVINNCKFYNIKEQAVLIQRGTGNLIDNVRMVNVGSVGGGLTSAYQYPQIYFGPAGNKVNNVYSDRSVLITDGTHITTPYIPEVAGRVQYDSYTSASLTLSQQTNPVYIFRLPLNSNLGGIPTGTTIYNIDYFYVSTHSHFSRKGVLSLVADVSNNQIQLSDEYEFAGADTLVGTAATPIQLDFTVSFLDSTGAKFTGAVGQNLYAVGFYYVNNLSGDIGTLTVSYQTVG